MKSVRSGGFSKVISVRIGWDHLIGNPPLPSAVSLSWRLECVFVHSARQARRGSLLKNHPQAEKVRWRPCAHPNLISFSRGCKCPEIEVVMLRDWQSLRGGFGDSTPYESV